MVTSRHTEGRMISLQLTLVSVYGLRKTVMSSRKWHSVMAAWLPLLSWLPRPRLLWSASETLLLCFQIEPWFENMTLNGIMRKNKSINLLHSSLNLNFSACSHLLCLCSSVCVGPVQKSHCWFPKDAAHLLLKMIM